MLDMQPSLPITRAAVPAQTSIQRILWPSLITLRASRAQTEQGSAFCSMQFDCHGLILFHAFPTGAGPRRRSR